MTHTLDGTQGDAVVSWPADVAPTLEAEYFRKRYSNQQFFSQQGGGYVPDAICSDRTCVTSSGDIAAPLRVNGGASEGVNDGRADNQCVMVAERDKNRGICLTPWDAETKRIHHENGIMATLAGSDGKGGQRMPYVLAFDHCAQGSERTYIHRKNGVAQMVANRPDAVCYAITERSRKDGRNFEAQEELAYALTNPGSGGKAHSRQIAGRFGVRRLTPRECERLQAFDDDYTAWGLDESGKRVEMSDSARYRMLGNAVCRNVARWIGDRIVEVDKALRAE